MPNGFKKLAGQSVYADLAGEQADTNMEQILLWASPLLDCITWVVNYGIIK